MTSTTKIDIINALFIRRACSNEMKLVPMRSCTESTDGSKERTASSPSWYLDDTTDDKKDDTKDDGSKERLASSPSSYLDDTMDNTKDDAKK